MPYPPGGPTDIIGRLTSGVLTKRLSENVVVDNRGGAATAIGAEMAARSPADGYTLLLSSETTFAVTPALKDKLPYHPERDFAPISLLTTQPYVLAVSLALPVNSVSQLVAHAKANPGKLTYGSAGAGGANHLAGEMFKHAAGHRHPARSLQGQRSRHHRSLRRPDLDDARQHILALPERRREEDPAARDRQREALRRARPSCRPSPRAACRASR